MIETKNLQSRLKEGFAKRLISCMLQNGHTSTRTQNGVSAMLLAKALGCSLTMARRYLAGEALPENKNMETLSKWLNVDAWWLLYGSKIPKINTGFDRNLMKEILQIAFPIFIHNNNKRNIQENIIEDIIKIYENLSELEGAEESRSRSVAIMVDMLKKVYLNHL